MLSQHSIDQVVLVYQVLESALSQFGEEGLAFSFNGGKDCTVLLPFFCTAVLNHRKAQAELQSGLKPGLQSEVPSGANLNSGLQSPALKETEEAAPKGSTATEPIVKDTQLDAEGKPKTICSVPKTEKKIKAIYFYLPNPFPEVENFINSAVEAFNLELTKIPSHNMKSGMEEYLREFPNVKAVVAGTRRTDPFSSHLTTFCPTDNGWPPLIRINPILDWSYEDVWEVMLAYKFPYCCLYDAGYTSLGSRDNTRPNPKLLNGDGFFPAFKLKNGCDERAGREKKP